MTSHPRVIPQPDRISRHAPLRPDIAALPGAAPADAASRLQAAFLAALGTPSPAIRHVLRPITDSTANGPVVRHEPLTLATTPDRLVPLGGDRWALVIREIGPNGGHSFPGAYSIAYLHRDRGRWLSDHVWFEIAYVGVWGTPGNTGETVHRFGTHPLFFATEEYCGMGQCSDTIDTIAFDDAAPIVFDEIIAGAVYPIIPDYPLSTTCQTYDATAIIHPPRTATALFSVTYAGWTAPAGQLRPRTRFRHTTDYVPSGTGLRMSPTVEVEVPDCAH